MCPSTDYLLVAREENIKRNNTMEKLDNINTSDKNDYLGETDGHCVPPDVAL